MMKKKTIYIALTALVLLCGCSKKIFVPNNKAEGDILQTTDSVVADTARESEKEQEKIQPIQIPEEWTTIKDDSLVVLESMSGELDSLLNSWYAET